MSCPSLDPHRAPSPSRRFGDLDVERTTTPDTSDRPALHGLARRRRRQTFQRCSVVLAALFVGATQCDPLATEPAAAPSPAAATAPAAPAETAPAAPAPTVAPPVAPHAAGPAVPAPSADPTPSADAADAAAAAVAPDTTVAAEPVRIPGPDGTSEHGRCTQYEDLLMIYAPEVGWDALRMSRLAWRESNCFAEIRSRTSDTGLLQINDITLEFLNEALGEQVDRWTLTDPIQNIRAAAALCTFWETNGSSCYQPWRLN